MGKKNKKMRKLFALTPEELEYAERELKKIFGAFENLKKKWVIVIIVIAICLAGGMACILSI
jgi:hypothetical protein